MRRTAGPKHGGYAVVAGGGVVGWVSGGEPLEGCDLVSVMIYASSPAEVRQRARAIGLWSPYVMSEYGEPDPSGVRAAVKDPDGFVWNHADGGEWKPSETLPRR